MPKTNSETLTIGAILPLTGGASVWGESIKNGMEIAQQELSQEGINIKFIYEDSKADSKEAISAYQSLKLKDVDVVVSAFSRVSIPIISLVDNDKIPLIMTIVAAKGVADESPYAFRFYVDEKAYADSHFNNINIGDYNTMGLLYINDEYGVSVSDHIKKRAEEKQIDIVAEENFNPGTTEFKTQLSKIKSKNPEMIMFVSSTPIEGINIVEEFNELQIDADLYESSSVLSAESTRKQASADGVYTSAALFLMQDSEFKNNYKETYNKDPSLGADFGYDIIRLVAKATNGQKLNGEAIAQNIINLKTFDSLNGKVDIQSNGEINPVMYSVKIVNGELELYNQ